MSKKLKALVVDDSAFSRQTIKKMLETDEDVQVVGIAADGMDAMSKTIKLEPDLITLDFEMPEMDGFSFLRWLMHERPTPVIMVSSYTDTKVAVQALELGAVDFISKPTRRASAELENIQKDLFAKVDAVRNINMDVLCKNIKIIEKKAEQKKQPKAPEGEDISLIAIGSSTGGPSALNMVLSELPRDLPCGIVISQHMPRGFTKPLADRLNKICSLNIKEAQSGDHVEAGHVYICPGGGHMKFKRRDDTVTIIIEPSDYHDKYAPSVDKMILSALDAFGPKILGVVLTGMGNDGTEGMKAVFAKGGKTLVESDETSVVFGMPQEVINAGAAQKVLPLYKISSEIRRLVLGERRM